MKNSGGKLILVMCGLALASAVGGWWSRYAATHRSAEFWGPEAATLLRGPSQVEFLELDRSVSLQGVRWDQANGQDTLPVIARHNITNAQGLSHLRSALVEDRNYDWDQSSTREGNCSPDASESTPEWVWALRLTERGQAITVLLTRDFSKLGKLQTDGQFVTWVSCRPLMLPLGTYFESLKAGWKRPGTKHSTPASSAQSTVETHCHPVASSTDSALGAKSSEAYNSPPRVHHNDHQTHHWKDRKCHEINCYHQSKGGSWKNDHVGQS